MGASTIVGRCTCAITAAVVKHLPEPVMPSRVWKRSPRSMPVGERGDRLGLVARGREVGDELEGRHRADGNGAV